MFCLFSKYWKIVFNIMILLVSTLLNLSDVFAQRVQGEIILSSVQINSSDNWSVDFSAKTGELRWWNDYKITTSYGSGFAGSATGPDELSPAIDAPNSYDQSGQS